MDQFDGRTLDSIIRYAEAQVSEIFHLLVVIRDRVAPAIPAEDLARVTIRQTIRLRVAPHPALRRATFAAEAATASLRRARDCAAAAKAIQNDGESDLAPAVRQAEARHWATLVQELVQTVSRAWAAVAREAERACSGKATVAELPVPVAWGS